MHRVPLRGFGKVWRDEDLFATADTNTAQEL